MLFLGSKRWPERSRDASCYACRQCGRKVLFRKIFNDIDQVMPKYYCEYCDIYLTHSSPGGRRQHNAGRKHINNKIDYFFNLIRDPNFLPPQHIVEAGFFNGFNIMMGGRQSVPALLRPPPLSQVNPWGNSLFMGRGVSPLNPLSNVANPMMVAGRAAPNFMVSQPGFRPRPFDGPQFP